jgi:hypothetical protein
LGYLGVPWTYNNYQTGDRNVRVRLDRAVASSSWSDWFPQAAVRHITSSRSDHVPNLLEFERENRLSRAPRIPMYKLMWERVDSLPREIKNAWESSGRSM